MKEKITITIDPEVIKKVKRKIYPIGGKVSSLINKLLEDFVSNGKKKNV